MSHPRNFPVIGPEHVSWGGTRPQLGCQKEIGAPSVACQGLPAAARVLMPARLTSHVVASCLMVLYRHTCRGQAGRLVRPPPCLGAGVVAGVPGRPSLVSHVPKLCLS